MRNEDLKAAFDQQASGYDQQWAKLAPIREGLHFLLESVFAEVPADARVLCVGAGTGAELAHLAAKFPRWGFTVVEPSGAMLQVCRRRAEHEGFAARCHFHEGYVDALPDKGRHHAATSFLVSQFILDHEKRVGFFRAIAERLLPGALLATSDLSSDVDAPAHASLVRAWMSMMAAAGIPPDGLARMQEAWKKDVAIRPPSELATIIEAGGFETPVAFYQAGLIHAWFARRA